MEKIYRKNDNYQAFKEGQEIVHKVLGKGVVVDFPEHIDCYNRWYHFVEVRFEGEKETRLFLPADLLYFLAD